MVDKDVVLEKIGNVQICLRRIQDTTKGKPESLDDIDVQDIFVLNLQRAVQTTIDLGAHVVSTEGLGLPDKLREIFVLIKNKKIIDAKLCDSLVSMVGFRNIAVHEYSSIEPAVLKSILTNHIVDLERFYEIILKQFQVV